MKAFKVLVFTVLLALVVASCTSSDDDGEATGSGSDNVSSEARGVTGDAIKVGGLSQLSNGWPGVEIGAEARFARANRDGGIHGREIDYIGTEDDGGDGAQNLNLARDLVLREEVFAIVPATSVGLLPQTTDFLETEKVPYIGWGFMPGYCGSSFGFGFNGCLIGADNENPSLAGPLVEGLDLAEGSTVAIQSWDNPPGRDSEPVHVGAWESFGMDVVHWSADLPGDDSPTDFTPFVQRLLSSDDGGAPDVIVTNAGFSLTTGLTAALKEAGYEGHIMGFVTYLPDLLASDADFRASLDGAYVDAQWLPAEFGGDAIEQIQADLEAIDEDPTVSSNISIGYWSADLLVQMLDAAGEDLSPERFDEAINGDGFTYESEFTPPGIGPVAYPENHDVAVPCGSLVRASGDEFEPILPMTCFG